MKEVVLLRQLGCYECDFVERQFEQIKPDYPNLVFRAEIAEADRYPTIVLRKSGFDIDKLEGLKPISMIKHHIDEYL